MPGAKVLELIEIVESASSTGTGFLGSPGVTTNLRSTQKGGGLTTDSVMIQESPRELAGYPYVSSMLTPSGHLFFGLFGWREYELDSSSEGESAGSTEASPNGNGGVVRSDR